MINIEEATAKLFSSNNPEKNFPTIEINKGFLLVQPSLVSEVLVKELFKETGLDLGEFSILVGVKPGDDSADASFDKKNKVINVFIEPSSVIHLFHEYVENKQINIRDELNKHGFDENADLLWPSQTDEILATFNVMLGFLIGGTQPHSKHLPAVRRTYSAIAQRFIEDWRNDTLPDSVRHNLTELVNQLNFNMTHELLHFSLAQHSKAVGYDENHKGLEAYDNKNKDFQVKHQEFVLPLEMAKKALRAKALTIKDDNFSILEPEIREYKHLRAFLMITIGKKMNAERDENDLTDYEKATMDALLSGYRGGCEELIIRIVMHRDWPHDKIKNLLDKQCFHSPGYLLGFFPDRAELYKRLDESGTTGALDYLSEQYPASKAEEHIKKLYQEGSLVIKKYPGDFNGLVA